MEIVGLFKGIETQTFRSYNLNYGEPYVMLLSCFSVCYVYSQIYLSNFENSAGEKKSQNVFSE